MPAAYHPTPEKKKHDQKQARRILLGVGALVALSWWTHRDQADAPDFHHPPSIYADTCRVRIEVDGSLTHLPHPYLDDNWPHCEVEIVNP